VVLYHHDDGAVCAGVEEIMWWESERRGLFLSVEREERRSEGGGRSLGKS
jgi:hypothetical protein